MSSLQKRRNDAMRGKWSEVFETYKQEREHCTEKITGTGDTVLHMAVSSGEQDVVAKMGDLAVREENDRDCKQSWNVHIILRAENDRKNTPLHFAAKMGNVEICKKIGDIEPSLIARHNIAGETPLFLSALNGRKEAFLWLHYRYMKSLGPSSTKIVHCIRDNGDTILHCTIEEGHIDVAIEIIHHYKDHLKELMGRNKEGLSPLHILASKRFCFRSSGFLQLPIVLHPIYRLWKVEDKNQATTLEELQKVLERRQHWIRKMKEKLEGWLYCIPKIKEKHTWTRQIMNELLQHASDEDMSQKISRNTTEHLSIFLPPQKDNETESGKIMIDTPLLIAARNDLVEMVEKILELFPSRVKDVNDEGRNVLLLATKLRRLEFVMNSMPYGFSERFNRKMETPDIMLRNRHKQLKETEGKWVANASQACSVVSTVVVSVAFATRTSVPGGYNENNKGYAFLRDNTVFKIFNGSSFAALFLSLISTICLVSVAVSPFQSLVSWVRAPFLLYFGVSFMLASIVCLWISFCAADFFILDDHAQKLNKSLPTYTVLSLMIILLVVTLIRLLLGPTFLSIFRRVAPKAWRYLPIMYKMTKAKETSTKDPEKPPN